MRTTKGREIRQNRQTDGFCRPYVSGLTLNGSEVVPWTDMTGSRVPNRGLHAVSYAQLFNIV